MLSCKDIYAVYTVEYILSKDYYTNKWITLRLQKNPFTKVLPLSEEKTKVVSLHYIIEHKRTAAAFITTVSTHVHRFTHGVRVYA